jgi:putative ABC transport system permease protein
MSWAWLWRMAVRDSRKSRSRLFLFTSSIILGIAALVAINSFTENIQKDIDSQAKELLGADLVIRSNQPISDSAKQVIDSVGREATQRARESNFASMVFFPKGSGTRLVQVRAIEGAFPFYGKIVTLPEQAANTFKNGQKALVDNTLMLQFGSQIGDSVKVGNVAFQIEGDLQRVPGQTGLVATVTSPVYIPFQFLEQTGLVKKGSRINYVFYFAFKEGFDTKALVEKYKTQLDAFKLSYDTVETRKQNSARAFENLDDFLNLVGFVALLLGCVGVASAVHVYIKEKIGIVAVLRCLGVKGREAFLIYLLQISAMGLLGSAIGAVLGSLIQLIMPLVFKDFLPIEVSYAISWRAIGEGILIGMLVAILFALVPLLSIRGISPLRTLRSSFEETPVSRDIWRWFTYLLITFFIYGFARLQISGWLQSFYFTLGLAGAFLLLTAFAQLIIWSVRKFFPTSWSYLWRQSLANLYRPNNQTLILVLSIGLGTALITTLYLVQSLLLSQVSFTARENQPNMVLFDIQTSQKDALHQLVKSFELPVIQDVPFVTMRLVKINGKTASMNRADTIKTPREQRNPKWAYDREYRVTYRDTLTETETSISGSWNKPVKSPSDKVFVSFDEGFADNMRVKLGDKLVFDVQGMQIETEIGHLRKVDFNRIQSNFLVLFPSGVLENAPQFHILVTKVKSSEQSAKFQRNLVQRFPNISVIDLDLILKTLDDVLNKVSFAIQFMAFFSILTGLLVLVGSVIISRFQRMQESVLLRTLGASRKQVLIINVLEYLFLGSLASFSGIILALGASWALAYFAFEVVFSFNILPALLVFVGITFLTMLIGLLNVRSVVNNPPLEVLRNEV